MEDEVFYMVLRSIHLVECDGHSALLVSCVVLVDKTLAGCLVHGLDCDLVRALGLGAIAFGGSDLKLLDSGLADLMLGIVVAPPCNLVTKVYGLFRRKPPVYAGCQTDFPFWRLLPLGLNNVTKRE